MPFLPFFKVIPKIIINFVSSNPLLSYKRKDTKGENYRTGKKSIMKKILIISLNPHVHFRQMKNREGITEQEDFRFFINDFNCNPDFVVVNSKSLRETQEFPIPKSHTILLIDEPHSVLEFPKGYYKQFGNVFSCQKEIKQTDGTKVTYTHAMLPWYIGAKTDTNGKCVFTKDFEAIENANPKKTKLISVISSNKVFSRGHLDRVRFIEKLRMQFSDDIDIFGRGFYEFEDKWDIIAPYKYHIVIENSCTDYYWTEKLADCYLAGTYPLYYGCKNIDESFPSNALTPIDIRNYESAIDTIRNTIKRNTYDKRKNEILKAKKLIMHKYNYFEFIAEACRHIPTEKSVGTTVLKPASHFLSLHNLYLYTIGRNFYKLSSKL